MARIALPVLFLPPLVQGFADDRECTCAVRQIFPLGGPFTGNTAVTVTGRAFRDLGDAKCRFGRDEVQARVVNGSRIECSSPGCSSPTCVTGQEQTFVTVPLEVSMNGVSFTGSGLQFTYYDMRHVAISRLTPAGGPRSGTTHVLVNGAGFRDMTSGADGVRLQGLKCKFGDDDMVAATKRSTSAAECVAPSYVNWRASNGSGATLCVDDCMYAPVWGDALSLAGDGRCDDGGPGSHFALCALGHDCADCGGRFELPSVTHAVPLELTFNGYDTAGTVSASGVPFFYYEAAAFNTSSLFPLGGPADGGAEVSVYLRDETLLLDLGGSEHGVQCRFSHERTVGELGHTEQHTVDQIVNGSLVDCGGKRQCGAGWMGVRCNAPAYASPLTRQLSPQFDTSFDGADVRVEVTINGRDYTNGGLLYRYYDPSVWMLHSFHPRGGPLTGKTAVNASGLRFQDLGDVRCRFGMLNEEVNGTIRTDGTIGCISPAHWLQQPSAQTIELEITLNGQDYLRTKPHQSAFTYYALDASPTGLSVHRLDPPGGPERGGTLVRVSGSGFVDVGGLMCKFAHEPAVPASLINQEHVRCLSPPRQSSNATGDAYDARAVEVTINGDVNATTSSSITFDYYAQTALAVSRIYPRGGPRAGGTAVTVWGAGFQELGHGGHHERPMLAGLHCRFGSLDLVPATLMSTGGAGPQQLTCHSPKLPQSNICETLVVRVTNNADNPPGGDAISSDEVGYSYFESMDGSDDGMSTPYGSTLLGRPADWTGGDVLR